MPAGPATPDIHPPAAAHRPTSGIQLAGHQKKKLFIKVIRIQKEGTFEDKIFKGDI